MIKHNSKSTAWCFMKRVCVLFRFLYSLRLSPIRTRTPQYRQPGKKTKLRTAEELNILPEFSADESMVEAHQDKTTIGKRSSPVRTQYPSKKAIIRRALARAEEAAEEAGQAEYAESSTSPTHRRKKARASSTAPSNSDSLLESSIGKLTLNDLHGS